MEKQFFDWDGWDQGDTAGFTFYNIKFKDNFLPDIKVREYACCYTDYESGIMTFYNDDNDEILKLKIGLVVNEVEQYIFPYSL